MQAAGGQAARQLTAPAPDLEHMITAADPRGPAGLIDEFVRIGRAVPVVLGRDLIKYRAVTTSRGSGQTCHCWASVMGGNLSHVMCQGADGAACGPSGLRGDNSPLRPIPLGLGSWAARLLHQLCSRMT